MGHVHSDCEEDAQHDSCMPSILSNNAESEEMEFEKMCNKLPLVLDVKQETDSKECRIESCPFGNGLYYPDYISSVSPHKDLLDQCVGPGNVASHPLCFFRRTLSLFSTPVNLRSSGFSFESTRSRKKAGDFVLKLSPSVTSGDTTVSSPGRWIFESAHANLKATALLNSPLLVRLGVLEGKKSHSRSMSADTRLVKSSNLCKSPSYVKQNELVSRLGTESTRSYESPASANSFSEGLLRCAWTGAVPYFVFSVDNGVGDVYVTSPQKVESSVDKALDYVYMFRSKSSVHRHNNSAGIVGKMKVSSSFVLDSNKSRHTETEFVMFGCREDHFKEMEGSSASFAKSKGLSKMVAEIFKPSHSFKHKSFCKFWEPDSELDDFMQKLLAVVLKDANEMGSVDHSVHDFHPKLELAAVVVKDYQCNRDRETATGGWGLKFLEKVQVSDAGDSTEPSSSCKMNVLLPAGFHGGAIDGADGPSSLTERWKSGGRCDCGGWDVGCPVTVLENTSVCSAGLIQDEPDEDKQPVCLSVEGARQGEPSLQMVNKSKDAYLINFHSSVSALQSFAIAVAVIHSRTPALYPKL